MGDDFLNHLDIDIYIFDHCFWRTNQLSGELGLLWKFNIAMDNCHGYCISIIIYTSAMQEITRGFVSVNPIHFRQFFPKRSFNPIDFGDIL